MADSPEDEAMAARVDPLEKKLDTLATSIDQRCKDVNAVFIEQRRYTEIAFSKFEAKMDAGFARMDDRFSRLERKLDQFIDTQTETNRLVELRLGPMKRRGPR